MHPFPSMLTVGAWPRAIRTSSGAIYSAPASNPLTATFAGAAISELGIVQIYIQGGATSSMGAGWSLVTEYTWTNFNGLHRVSVYQKILDAGDIALGVQIPGSPLSDSERGVAWMSYKNATSAVLVGASSSDNTATQTVTGFTKGPNGTGIFSGLYSMPDESAVAVQPTNFTLVTSLSIGAHKSLCWAEFLDEIRYVSGTNLTWSGLGTFNSTHAHLVFELRI